MSNQNDRVRNLGQVFTRDDIVRKMLSLRKTTGRTLEPSAGDGAFSKHLRGCVAIELDRSVAPDGAKVMDFFAYPVSEKFQCIIGNPPYVRHNDIRPTTKKLLDGTLFDRRTNLYLYFIEKCVRHLEPGGELIFIVPREFIKLTSSRKLNHWLYEQGTITHFIETGDSSIFGPYVPNCAIFRFEKGLTDRRMNDGRIFAEVNGQLLFTRRQYSVRLSDLFHVKVGAVSGADEIFIHPQGNKEFVCSTTIDTGQTRRAYYDVKNKHLERHKAQLLARRIRKFDDTNWWMWGRRHHVSDFPRIYVNVKTRRPQPFFRHDACKDYDGSILALFPKDPNMDLTVATNLLNTSVDWEDLGFVCDGRFMFSQRGLEQCLLPDCFNELRKLHLTQLPSPTPKQSKKSKLSQRAA